MLRTSSNQTSSSPMLETAVMDIPVPGPSLVVLEPEALRGQSFPLVGPTVTIGRSQDSRVRLADAYVSRRHAVITQQHDAVTIEDAGSRAGVSVNGRPVNGPTPISEGDRVQIGRVVLEMRGPDPGHAAVPRASADVIARPAPERRFAVHGQYAGAISNVAGNQYNEHALRIAPMRRRARNVMRTGFLLMFAGLAVGVIGMARFATPILNCLRHPDGGACTAGIDTGGWAMGAAGSVILSVGVLIIIVSLCMKRAASRKERQL